MAVDVVIVGAGPAGAAAALSAIARRPSVRVVLMDRDRFPRDKTCGDGIGPVGVAALAELGVSHVLSSATRVDQLRITTAARVSAAGHVAAPGYVLPRKVLDAALVEAATARGAELRHERVMRLAPGRGGVTVNGHLTASTVIGADGVHSVTRRAIGAGTHPRRHRAVSLRAYATSPTTEHELIFRLPHEPWPSYAWAFPLGEGRANVGVVLLDGRTRASRSTLFGYLTELLPEWNSLPHTLQGFHLPLSPGRPALARGRVLLAGDAAGLVNPVSGEGIATALVSGMLAGRSAVDDPVEPGRAYRNAMARTLGRHLRHSGWAARVMTSRAWADATVAAANTSPRVFAALAELTVGTGPLPLGVGARIAVQRARPISRS